MRRSLLPLPVAVSEPPSASSTLSYQEHPGMYIAGAVRETHRSDLMGEIDGWSRVTMLVMSALEDDALFAAFRANGVKIVLCLDADRDLAWDEFSAAVHKRRDDIAAVLLTAAPASEPPAVGEAGEDGPVEDWGPIQLPTFERAIGRIRDELRLPVWLQTNAPVFSDGFEFSRIIDVEVIEA